MKQQITELKGGGVLQDKRPGKRKRSEVTGLVRDKLDDQQWIPRIGAGRNHCSP